MESHVESTSAPASPGYTPATRARFFALVRRLRTATRPELMEHSGLSRAAAYGLAEELCMAGVLVPQGVGQSRGGRRPQVLGFEPEAWCAIGVEFGERALETVLTDLDGRVLARSSGPTRATEPQEVVDAVAASVDRLGVTAGSRRLLGLGFATPGLFDADAGLLRLDVLHGWRDAPLPHMLRDRIGLPAFVANRSKAAAVGEMHSGAGAGARSLAYVYAGRGIAAGLMLDGELYSGASSHAGELGHITVEPDGALCGCGSRGCLHTVASGEALLKRARAAIADGAATGLLARAGGDPAALTTLDLAEAAADGDPVALDLVDQAVRYLGIAVGVLINMVNPERVIVGGDLGRAGPQVVDAIRSEARRRSLSWPFEATEILPSALGPDAGSVGAAVLVLRQAANLVAARLAAQDGASADLPRPAAG